MIAMYYRDPDSFIMANYITERSSFKKNRIGIKSYFGKKGVQKLVKDIVRIKSEDEEQCQVK